VNRATTIRYGAKAINASRLPTGPVSEVPPVPAGTSRSAVPPGPAGPTECALSPLSAVDTAAVTTSGAMISVPTISAGCHTRSNSTMANAPASEAMMSATW